MSEYIGKAYIVSPVDEETGEPIDLYFVVTEDGLLLHMEKTDDTVPGSVVQDELGKIIFGIDSSRGRFNEFIKNPKRYVIRMAVVPPLTIADARRIDEKYRMSKEKRMEAFEKEKELWVR